MLISTLLLTIFLLFIALDTSGTWNVNRPVTKTSTRDTYSALPGSKNFILAKNWSQDPIFMVKSFLTILSTSSEFSTSHAFHLFKLILFCGYFFCAPKLRKNIKKNKMKKSRNPKKQRQPKNREKRGPKVEQYLRST